MAGFDLPFHQRVAMLVEMVGGLGKAAQIAKVDPDTVNNWRKEGARVPLLGVLPLAVSANVSLDWVAVGHQIREDLKNSIQSVAAGELAGVVRLQPWAGGEPVEEAPGAAVAVKWLQKMGLDPESTRYLIAVDDAMKPLIGRGAAVIVDDRPGKLRSGIYALVVGEEHLIRRLNRLPNGVAELVADAEPTWRYVVGDHDQSALRRVVWVGQAI